MHARTLSRITALCLGLGLLATSFAAYAGATVKVSEHKWLGIGLLLQPQLYVQKSNLYANTANEETRYLIDPMVKRARIMVYGQLSKSVTFFAETDTAKIGYQGNFGGSTFMQDAYVEFNVAPQLQISTGLILIPFSHHAMQGATSLMGLDYHGSVIRPVGAFQDAREGLGQTKVWRDVGIMARGQFLDQKVEYRLALTNGVQRKEPGSPTARPLNLNDFPRITARLGYNFFESEAGPGIGGMFFDGIYLKEDGDRLLSPKKIVSLGGSFSYQKSAHFNPAGNPRNYIAGALDVFVDMPLGDSTRSLNGQINYYDYYFGSDNPATGRGFFAEWGYRMNKLQPVVAMEYFDVRSGDTGDFMAYNIGLNYYVHGHNASIKVDYGSTKKKSDVPDNDSWGQLLRVQTQLLF